MDLNQLRYFLAVLDRDTINAAAGSLGVTQPTISQAIKGLEREMGLELFHRIGRGMAPTSAGYALAGPARQILRDIASAESSVEDDEGHVRGRLEITVLPSLTGGILTDLVVAFRRRYPKVTITLGNVPDESAVASLIREGHRDVVITHFPPEPPIGATTGFGAGSLEMLPLGVQEYWLALPPAYAGHVSATDPLPWAEIPDLPLVVVPRGSVHAEKIQEAITRAGQERKVSVVVQHREARLPFVLAGAGGTFIERSLAEQARVRGAVICSLEPPLSGPYGILYDPLTISPLGRAFINLARVSAQRDLRDAQESLCGR